MGWKQVRNFNINKMGKKKDWCLGNCEDGFGISKAERKEASAKTDYLNQKKNGTLHGIDSLPLNVAVPIYCDTPSQYEHVIVCDHGVCYSDGYRTDINKYNVFGWGECCGGVRVVEYVNEPAKKPNEEIAKEVIEGKWGNGADRKKRLENAGYNYNAIQSIVNVMVKSRDNEIKVGDKVIPKTLVDYNGTRLISYHKTYVVSEIKGDRAVLKVNGSIWCAMNINNLIKL